MATRKRWMKVPPKPVRPKIPDDFKQEVQKKADQFLESYLKPTFILPPPKEKSHSPSREAWNVRG